MTKRRNSGRSASKTRGKRRKTARAKMKMHGMPIDIPPELDLPAGAPFEGRELPATMKIPEDIQELFAPLVEMATNAWRLKVRMIDRDSGEPREEVRKLYRFVEGLFRALKDAGIQVIDKTGKRYDDGMSEKVIAFEQTPGLLKDEILETVRPSIRWKERSLYHGEIVVGIPMIEAAPGEEPKGEALAVSSETDSVAIQPAEVSECRPAQREGLPDPDENESPEMPESDAPASDRQPVAAEADPGSDQLDADSPGNSSGEERTADVAGDASAAPQPEDAQGQEYLVGPGFSHNPKQADQVGKE